MPPDPPSMGEMLSAPPGSSEARIPVTLPSTPASRMMLTALGEA